MANAPNIPTAVIASIDDTVAALKAIRKLSACRGAVGSLRAKFGGCSEAKTSVDASVAQVKQASAKTSPARAGMVPQL